MRMTQLAKLDVVDVGENYTVTGSYDNHTTWLPEGYFPTATGFTGPNDPDWHVSNMDIVSQTGAGGKTQYGLGLRVHNATGGTITVGTRLWGIGASA